MTLSLGDIVADPRLVGVGPGDQCPPFVEIPQMIPMPRPGEHCWLPLPDGARGRFQVLRTLCRLNGPKSKMVLFVVPYSAAKV